MRSTERADMPEWEKWLRFVSLDWVEAADRASAVLKELDRLRTQLADQADRFKAVVDQRTQAEKELIDVKRDLLQSSNHTIGELLEVLKQRTIAEQRAEKAEAAAAALRDALNWCISKFYMEIASAEDSPDIFVESGGDDIGLDSTAGAALLDRMAKLERLAKLLIAYYRGNQVSRQHWDSAFDELAALLAEPKDPKD